MTWNTEVVGFTGTQIGMQPAQLEVVRRVVIKASELHHGVCIGADEQVHRLAISGTRLVGHPPINTAKMATDLYFDKLYDPKEYLARNRTIVDVSQLLIAAPRQIDEQQRSGTWSTWRYANHVRKPWLLVFPDGSWKAYKGDNEYQGQWTYKHSCKLCRSQTMHTLAEHIFLANGEDIPKVKPRRYKYAR